MFDRTRAEAALSRVEGFQWNYNHDMAFREIYYQNMHAFKDNMLRYMSDRHKTILFSIVSHFGIDPEMPLDMDERLLAIKDKYHYLHPYNILLCGYYVEAMAHAEDLEKIDPKAAEVYEPLMKNYELGGYFGREDVFLEFHGFSVRMY